MTVLPIAQHWIGIPGAAAMRVPDAARPAVLARKNRDMARTRQPATGNQK
ncbi:MAG: hypothetical protein LC118_20820 [Dehalococcoidia bacterium]|nr:hypothetical protein [Dehalococcoidia bacterium]